MRSSKGFLLTPKFGLHASILNMTSNEEVLGTEVVRIVNMNALFFFTFNRLNLRFYAISSAKIVWCRKVAPEPLDLT